MGTASASATATQIDNSDDEIIVMETVKIVPIENAIEVGNGALSKSMPNEIDGDTIATQKTSNANNPNDG